MPSWANISLFSLSVILFLRLIIWQFFRNTDAIFRENFSDSLVAFLILSISIPWLILKIIKRQSIQRSGLELPIFILFLAAACSLFFSVDFSSTLRAVLVLVSEIVFFYMLLDFLDTQTRIREILIFLIGLSFCVALYGIKTFFDFSSHSLLTGEESFQSTDRSLYYLLTHGRAISFLGWPNTLAGYQLLFLPMLIILPFHLQKNWHKVISSIILFSFTLCFVYTFSFLGWLSFLLSGAIFLPIFWKKLEISKWSNSKKGGVICASLLFLILFIFVILHKNFLMSLAPRVFYYHAAFELLAKNPLWGYGLDCFGMLCRPLTDNINNLSSYIHNSYLQIWIETGILGFLGLIFLVVEVFKKTKKGLYSIKQNKNQWILIAIAWGLCAFLIDNLFSFTLLKANVALFWWAMLAIFCAAFNENIFSKDRNKAEPKFLTGGCLFILLLVFILLLRLTGGYSMFYQAKNLAPEKTYKESMELLIKAQRFDPWSSYIPTEQGEIYLRAYTVTGKEVFLKEAEFSFLESIKRSPYYYYNYLLLGKIYGIMGNKLKENILLQKAHELSPAEFDLDIRTMHNPNLQVNKAVL